MAANIPNSPPKVPEGFRYPELPHYIEGTEVVEFRRSLPGRFPFDPAWVIPVTENACCICFTNKINTVFVDCGHLISCPPCSVQVQTCPVCRANIKSRIRVIPV